MIEFNWNCLPAWAEYIAMDEDGSWKWYSDRPFRRLPEDTYWTEGYKISGEIPEHYWPKNDKQDWKQNIYKKIKKKWE